MFLFYGNTRPFFSGAELELIHARESRALALLRTHPDHDARVLVLVNPDCDSPNLAVWPAGREGSVPFPWVDLITGDFVKADNKNGQLRIQIKPGGVLALSPKKSDLDHLEQQPAGRLVMPDRTLTQKRRALALEVITAIRGHGSLEDLDVDQAAASLAKAPEEFIRSLCPDQRQSRVILFDVQKDIRRRVMIPPGFFLVVQCPRHFRARILDTGPEKQTLGYRESLLSENGTMFRAVFTPMETKDNHWDCHLNLRIFRSEGTIVQTGHLRFLAPFETLNFKRSFTRKQIAKDNAIKQLSTSQKGAMMRAAANFGYLESKYDGLLGANLNPNLPENRWMLLSRFRIWAVFQGYSRQLSLDCLDAFWASSDQGGKWRFRIPSLEGRYYVIDLFLEMDRAANRVLLTLHRETAPEENPRRLQPDRKVSLIIRPDIEDRSFHDTVKAFAGPEEQWPGKVSAFETGFFFHSQTGKVLRISSSQPAFSMEPEWQYMVHREVEATRGLDADSDLFSPGFFTICVQGGETVCLESIVMDEKKMPDKTDKKQIPLPGPFVSTLPFSEAVAQSLDAFIVDRGEGKSVVAGYPWFLDWGRDSLIFCRALTESGRTQDAFAMLTLFGKFEQNGTLPNMICGEDARNIETSDAPLWFFACCRQLAETLDQETVLGQKIGNRTMRTLLIDMANAMIQGTPTGVKADPGSMLLYSPPHFTWMDTNYPAGTPRQGYPVEIQALWYHALEFLAAGGWERYRCPGSQAACRQGAAIHHGSVLDGIPRIFQ